MTTQTALAAPANTRSRKPRAAWRYRTHAEPNYQVRGSQHPHDKRHVFFAYRDGRIVPTVYSADECEAHRQMCLLYLGLLAGDGQAGADVPF